MIEALVDEAALQGWLRTEREDVLLDIEIDGLRCLVFLPTERCETGASLSAREREIAQLVAAGWPNKTIAAQLGISSWTVSTHLRRIFAKLGVRSRAAMVAQVAELGAARALPENPTVRLSSKRPA